MRIRSFTANRCRFVAMKNSQKTACFILVIVWILIFCKIGLNKTSSRNFVSQVVITTTDRPQTTPKTSSDAQIILVVAYMRTGSTLLGEILHQIPGSFYLFEPLRTLENTRADAIEANRTSFTLEYLFKKPQQFKISSYDGVIHSVMKSLLTCSLDELPSDILTDRHHSVFIDSLNYFEDCSSKHIADLKSMHTILNQTQTTNSTNTITKLRLNDNLRKCLLPYTASCRNSSAVVMKFIRLRMRHAIRLLSDFPKLKIVHLVRDPRGIIDSQMRTGFLKSGTAIAEECHAIASDLVFTKYLMENKPSAIKLIQYEDFAEEPLKMLKELRQFTGLNFGADIEQFIFNKTSAAKDNGEYTTGRKNSTETAYKWRTHLDFQLAVDIEKACAVSNSVLGYLPFHSKESLKNILVSPRRRTNVTHSLITNINF
ncbi:carbohydrate sulfotransferase 1-like [Dreissena polymorpha]|uniref:Sulfotransferase domain-containing protein n=1 Tax=Dreissena polymorpha TaxID=45954 RepID=A0A9D4K990_DREPO|nr:carbohydrate sulfotransferase 1-like [Dreissena polymorpha]KAH3835151.1 hypothetical protein DPMN_108497 [Dreissena polymorpha]